MSTLLYIRQRNDLPCQVFLLGKLLIPLDAPTLLTEMRPLAAVVGESPIQRQRHFGIGAAAISFFPKPSDVSAD